MNYPPSTTSHSKQGGYASLTIGVILLFMLSLASIYLTRSGILDIRTSANKARSAQAFASAESTLDAGYAWLSNSKNMSNIGLWATGQTIAVGDERTSNGNAYTATTAGTTGTTAPSHTSGTASDGGVSWSYIPGYKGWVTCNNNSIPAIIQPLGTDWLCLARSLTLNNSTGTETATFYLATPVSAPNTFFKLIATAAFDGATSLVQQGIYFSPGFFPGTPGGPPPLMGAGNIPLNGTFNVVANPNGGGQGVPVSIWSKMSIDNPQGSAKTCHAQDYNGGCNNPLSKKDVKGVDIVDYDPSSFPPDMFKFVFGVNTDNYTTVRDNTNTTILSDCSTLGPASTGTYWITGDCVVPSNTTFGSREKPIVLIVASSDTAVSTFRMNANSTFYGLIFGFGPSGNAGSMTMNGGATVYGSIMSNNTTSMGVNINGTFNMIYDTAAMQPILDDDGKLFKLMSRMPRSWSDYIQ